MQEQQSLNRSQRLDQVLDARRSNVSTTPPGSLDDLIDNLEDAFYGREAQRLGSRHFTRLGQSQRMDLAVARSRHNDSDPVRLNKLGQSHRHGLQSQTMASVKSSDRRWKLGQSSRAQSMAFQSSLEQAFYGADNVSVSSVVDSADLSP